ncbi:hypothetical protein C2G38_2227674 [Gigaspora rosea]|uniref:Uncharacterized protein n=1 Tax=Gigaspora rosea TaxID=44941 RepID=A0A397TWU6_9GLOM|nr:hypothetical protein C2G38_2227674 [Gigaspora rosea]
MLDSEQLSTTVEDDQDINNVTNIHSDHNESPNSSSDTNNGIVGHPRDKPHLTIKCPKVSNDIQIKYLCTISNKSSQEIADLSTTCSNKKLKSNYTIPLTAYYNLDKIDENKTKQANQSFVCLTTLSGSVLDSKIATITLKLNKILKNATNLTLYVNSWALQLKQSIYAFIIILPDKWQYVHSIEDYLLYLYTSEFNAKKIIQVLE